MRDKHIRMAYVLLSLTDISRQSLGRAMFARLVLEDDVSNAHQLLQDFIVNYQLPKLIKLSILRAFILALDRGHTCLSDKDCSVTSCKRRFWDETHHAPECQFFKSETSMHERRFRATALSRQCVQVVMATWGDTVFSPGVLVENGYPIGLSLRMRQWLVMYAVDGFLMCHDICQSSFPITSGPDVTTFQQKADQFHLCASVKDLRRQVCEKAEREKKNKTPMVLDLRARDTNVHCTRAALTALKLALERTKYPEPSEYLVPEQTVGPLGAPKSVPTIKLEVAVIGSIHDWFSDVLLSVLQKSRIEGLNIDLSSLRFEDVSPHTAGRIIRSLPNPSEIRELNFRHVDPQCLLQARDALCDVTGVEQFALATCDYHPATYTSTDTLTLWNEIFSCWPKLRTLEFSGIRMCFHLADGSISGVTRGAKEFIRIPPSLRSLEFSNDSVTTDVLLWLNAYYGKRNDDITKDLDDVTRRCCLRTLRFRHETGLARQQTRDRLMDVLTTGKHFIEDVTIHHCGITDADADDVINLFDKGLTYLRRLVILEPAFLWKTTIRVFKAAMIRNNPASCNELISFSALVPRASDTTVDPQLVSMQAKFPISRNPRCAFEESLQKLAKDLGYEGLEIELFWEPECDFS
uniref:uncharacterized protein LOC100183253 isoform X2 n=1 Tax=Ciona intestinalis TaxID=7719 RepID=UPI000EF47BCC|nr:uncharacterized protein LOC100183253 isoform X2 [Ciona intestinalis]|eukprot:XP_026691689.1 uncharacterized protein LOC100183253 isoform X2 [Ciona intestinalis]